MRSSGNSSCSGHEPEPRSVPASSWCPEQLAIPACHDPLSCPQTTHPAMQGHSPSTVGSYNSNQLLPGRASSKHTCRDSSANSVRKSQASSKSQRHSALVIWLAQHDIYPSDPSRSVHTPAASCSGYGQPRRVATREDALRGGGANMRCRW